MKHYTVLNGSYTMKHYRAVKPMQFDLGVGGDPPQIDLTDVCETRYPAGVCTCREYLLIWGEQ